MKIVKNNKPDIQEEWKSKGEKYAREINEMIAFGEKNGWENWSGKEAGDTRGNLAEEVIRLLKLANIENNVARFRDNFPPAHAPIATLLDEYAQSI
jgi:hypothetical protein